MLNGIDIRELMRILNVTYADIENETGVTSQTIRNIISGKFKTTKVVMYALTCYFQKIYRKRYYESDGFRGLKNDLELLEKLEKF